MRQRIIIVLLLSLHATSAFLSHSRKSVVSHSFHPSERHELFHDAATRLVVSSLRQQQHEQQDQPQPAHANVTATPLLSIDSPFRRQVLLGSLTTTTSAWMLSSRTVAAADAEATTTTSPSLLGRILSQIEKSKLQQQQSSSGIAKNGRLYVVSAKKNVTISPQRTPLDEAIPSSWGEGDGVTDRLIALSSQICLLRLLPVKNVFFRSLETNIVRLSAVTLTGSGSASVLGGGSSSSTMSVASSSTSSSMATVSSMMTKTIPREDWAMATERLVNMINEIDSKRSMLAPVFNLQDSTQLAISKGERGEQLIESLRQKLSEMISSTQARNVKLTLQLQKQALLALSEIGELLVTTFPYDVPRVGKFSYLPRLLGRARVTFTIMRPYSNNINNNNNNNNKILGNITIVADGYAAPITAGNFVDLCARQFYTGLPIFFGKKKLGDVNSKSPTSEFDVVTLPIFGMFQQEGFYDPLTAKPRRIPLEIIRVEKSTGLPSLTYYPQGLPSLLTSKTTSTTADAAAPSKPTSATATTTTTVTNNTTHAAETNANTTKPPVTTPVKASTTGKTVLEPTSYSEPLLTFNIPGLVAMNHPDNYPNGASAEFFALQDSSINNSGSTSTPDKRRLLDGEYAPFGYIVEGYDLFQQLQPNDVIEATTIDEWGLLNLVKIRQSSFAQVLESASVDNGGGGSNNANNAASTD